MVTDRRITKYFQLDERRSLHVELHSVGTVPLSKTSGKKWLTDDQLSEINKLLKDIISKCRNDVGKGDKKVENTSQIITGDNVRLGCVFKKFSSHDILLVEDSDDESPYTAYSSYRLKLVVYVCPIEPGSPQRESELYRVMNRHEKGAAGNNHMLKISSYFNTSTQEADGSGGARDLAPSTDPNDHQKTIRNLMKRGEMSRRVKKRKKRSKSGETKDENSKCKFRKSAKMERIPSPQVSRFSDNTSTVHDVDDGCLATDDDLRTADGSELDNANLLKGRRDSERLQPSTLRRHKSEKATKSFGHCLGTITLCDELSNSNTDCLVSPESTITVYNADQLEDMSVPSVSTSNTSFKVYSNKVRTIACATVSSPTVDSSGREGEDEDTNDSVLPSYSFIGQNGQGETSATDGDVDNQAGSDTNIDSDQQRHFEFDSDTNNSTDRKRTALCNSNSDDDDEWLTRLQRKKSTGKTRSQNKDQRVSTDNSMTDSDGYASLISLKRRMRTNRVLPSFSFEHSEIETEIPSNKQKDAPKIKFFKRKNDMCDSQKTTSNVKMPSLVRRKKSKELRQSVLPFLTSKRQGVVDLSTDSGDTGGDRVAEDGSHDCILVSEELRQDLRLEVKRAKSVKELNEEHMQFLVQDNKNYLKEIFQGDTPCDRHSQYKEGGKARTRLNHQVYLGLFSEEQQDVVMETLMSIFCRKNHRFLDYVMKVILPEILIKIYMEVSGLSHDDAEDKMACGGT